MVKSVHAITSTEEYNDDSREETYIVCFALATGYLIVSVKCVCMITRTALDPCPFPYPKEMHPALVACPILQASDSSCGRV